MSFVQIKINEPIDSCWGRFWWLVTGQTNLLVNRNKKQLSNIYHKNIVKSCCIRHFKMFKIRKVDAVIIEINIIMIILLLLLWIELTFVKSDDIPNGLTWVSFSSFVATHLKSIECIISIQMCCRGDAGMKYKS